MKSKTLPEETLGQRLRSARKLKGLFLKDVAAQAEISADTLRNWETDRYQPHNPRDLKKVAAVLEVEMEHLLGPLPENASLSDKLQYYRKCRGWTRGEFANSLGVNSDYLGKAEQGRYISYIHQKAAKFDEDFFAPTSNFEHD